MPSIPVVSAAVVFYRHGDAVLTHQATKKEHWCEIQVATPGGLADRVSLCTADPTGFKRILKWLAVNRDVTPGQLVRIDPAVWGCPYTVYNRWTSLSPVTATALLDLGSPIVFHFGPAPAVTAEGTPTPLDTLLAGKTLYDRCPWLYYCDIEQLARAGRRGQDGVDA
jgi:hypothetical protein